MKNYVASIKDHVRREALYRTPFIRPKRILFDHIPKCAGTSLSMYLEAHYPKRQIFSTVGASPRESVKLFKGLPEEQRLGYRLVKGHLANDLLGYAHPDCLKVTVLREPVDRIVSHYYYAKRKSDHYLHSQIHELKMSLEDYATSGLGDELRNWYTVHFAGVSPDEAELRPEESIVKAYEVLMDRYELVGLLENFGTFVDELRRRANLRLAYQGIKSNVTKERPRIENSPPSAIRKIEELNYLDIELYKRIRAAIG